jgi:hypothetical protein
MGLWSGCDCDWFCDVFVVQDSEVEGSVGRSGCWAVDASDRVRGTAHKLGHLHSHACGCIGISLWD